MMRLPATVLVVICALAGSVWGQTRTLVFPNLRSSVAVGYDFPNAGVVNLALESHVSGDVDASFCPTTSTFENAAAQCKVQIQAQIIRSAGLPDQVLLTGHFEFGELKFQTSDSTRLFLGEAFPSPTLNTVGRLSLSVVADAAAGGSISKSMDIVSGPAVSFTSVFSTGGTAGAGDSVTLTATARDTFGNKATAETGQVTWQIQGPVSGSQTRAVSMSQGEATYTFTVVHVETMNATATYTGLPSPATAFLVVTPGATTLMRFESTLLAAPEFNDTTIRIFAMDAFGNINTGEDRSMPISRNAAVQPSPAVFSSGVASVSTGTSLSRGVYIYTMSGSPFTFSGVNFTSVLVYRATAVCNGVTEYQDEPGQTSCKEVSDECGVGTFEESGPNATSDRVCIACDGITEFQDETDQTSCKPMSPNCTEGFFSSTVATPSTDRTCSPCPNGTFSDEVNLPQCKNVTACVPGETLIAMYTSTTDNDCEPCAPGYVDDDSNPATACVTCSPVLSARATLSFATVSFTTTRGQSTEVTVNMTDVPTSTVSNWTVMSGSCRFPKGSAVFECVNHTGAACGLLRDRLGPFVSATYTDSVLSVIGENSVYQRALVVYDDEGSEIECANIATWMGALPTVATEAGQTQCSNVTQCQPGSAEVTPFDYDTNRECGLCQDGVDFQDVIGGRFCIPLTECVEGQTEQLPPPSISNDRTCAGITCPSLDPPLYGNITTCKGNGTREDFLTQCTYSCNVEDAFQPISVTRTCTALGVFDGVEPTCICEGSLRLDALNGRCVSSCPDGFIVPGGVAGPGARCEECAPTCTPGSFESVACDSVNNVDRVCQVCRTCPDGFFASGGCDPTSKNDTMCQPFTPCPDGMYETGSGTPTSDRVCSACRPCTSSTSIELYAAGGCCGTTNTICEALSDCPDDMVEVGPPVDAPQGGFGSDRRCKTRRECGVGEYVLSDGDATTDRVCMPCSTCEDSYAVVNCTLTEDTQCADYTDCPDGTYLQGQSPYVDGTCVPFDVCASFEHEESSVIDGEAATTCVANKVCDHVTEYEVRAPTISSDRECQACSVCGEGNKTDMPFMTEPCDTFTDTVCAAVEPGTVVCSRGRTLIGTAPVTFCAPCNDCPAGQYAKGGAKCPNTTPSLKHTDPRCANVTVCPDGFVEHTPPTPSTDRVCQRCARCPTGSYSESTLCTSNVTELNCIADPPCAEGTYEVVGGTPTQFRQCRKCRSCRSDEFASRECTGFDNTVCTQHRICSSTEALLRPGTATSDAICRNCSFPGVGTARPGNDLYLCPASPHPDVCPAPSVATPVLLSTDHAHVEFALSGDYDTVVGLPSHIFRIELFQDDFDAFMENAVSASGSITNVQATSGSIMISFDVTSTDEQPFNETLIDVMGVLSDGFEYEYEGSTLPIVAGSQSSEFVEGFTTTLPTGPTLTLPVTTTAGSTTVATTVDSDTGNAAAKSDDDDNGITTGVLIAIILAAVILVLNIGYIIYHKKTKHDSFTSSSVVNPSMDGDGYIGVGTLDESGNVYDSQLAAENRMLKEEVEGMNLKISEKNAVISEQMRSRLQAEEVLQVAVAKKLSEDNKALKRSITTMKSELKKKQNASRFQKAAATQVQLLAERAALEEEIATADQVTQVALQVLAEQTADDADE